MTAFAGVVFDVDDDASASRIEEVLLAIIGRRDDRTRPFVQRSARAIIVQHGDRAPDSSGVLFAASARLDDRGDIAAAVGLDAREDDAALIRRQLELHGDQGIARLLGAFAFAHWSESTGRLTLGRDCLGRRSVFFHRGNGFVAFASLLIDLLDIPGVPFDLDERMLARLIAIDGRQGHQIIYRGVHRVPSRTVVEVTAHEIRSRRYWSPQLHGAAPYRKVEDYVHRARELFDIAVKRSIGDSTRIAVSTSGGLDSSAVAATAARLGHAEVTCYTLLPPDDFAMTDDQWPGHYVSERPKLEALTRLHPSLRMRFVTPRENHPLQVDGRRIFALTACPWRNIANLDWFAALDDTVRDDGYHELLTGGWGNFGLSWEGTAPGELARTKQFGPLVRETIAAATRGRLPLASAIARGITRNVRALARRGVAASPADAGVTHLLHPEMRELLGRADDETLEALDEELRWASSDPVEQRTAMLFDQAQIARDRGAMYVETMGYESHTPHIDRDLLEFCLAVPERYYCRDGVPRWFARQVLADRLPPEIVDEQRRGLQAPNWFSFLDMRKRAIAECVDRMKASALTARLIDMPRLERLVAEWPADQYEAERRSGNYMQALNRAVHIGEFIAWVEERSAQRQLRG